MQFFRGKKLDDDCPICLQPMYSKKVKKLVCNHVLHTNCYNSLISSNCNKTCPVCRCDLSAPVAPEAPVASSSIRKICAICKTELEVNKETCDIIKIKECPCYVHYLCIKKMRKQQEKKECHCNKQINTRNIILVHNENFEKIYEQVIGKISSCREKSCKITGCPKFYGYCEMHAKEKTTDAVFNLSLQFVIRQMKGESEKERRYLFYQVMTTLDAYKLSNMHTYQDAIEILKRHL
jgi:Ring finger domain